MVHRAQKSGGAALVPLVLDLLRPWTLNFSAHIVNPSYVLTGASCSSSARSSCCRGCRSACCRVLAFACMGFGLLWVYQLHLAFTLMLPFVAVVFALRPPRELDRRGAGRSWFAAGAAIPALALLPTLIRFGLASSVATAGANMVVDVTNVVRIPEITARFLSFASFELPRFLGNNTASRLEFLSRHPWSIPFVIFAGVVGLLQPFVLLVSFSGSANSSRVARRQVDNASDPPVDLRELSLLREGSCVSRVLRDLSGRDDLRVLLLGGPVRRRSVRGIAATLLVCTAAVHLAIAIDHVATRSLYTNRELVVRAIREKNYRLLGERRPVSWREQSEGCVVSS